MKSGGTARAVVDLCNYLGRQKVVITLLSVDPPNDKEGYVQQDSKVVNHLRIQSRKVPLLNVQFPIGYFKSVRELSLKGKFEIVHDHGLWLPCNHASSVSASKLNVPLVVSPHGMLEPWALKFKASKKKTAWRLWVKKDLLSASGFCATSMQEAQNIRALGFKQPIAVIPNGVDIPLLEREFKVPDRTVKQALFLSRIHPKKGLCELVNSWAALRPAGWELIIAGPDEGGHRQAVAKLINAYNLQESVRFIGPVDGNDKWRLYQQSDFFVLPTFSENFGIVVAEALAASIPVITTKGAPWEGLHDYKCGWWVDIGSDPLTAALREAISLPDQERRMMGLRGRKMVTEKYSWNRISSEMIEFYQWLLGGGTPPACVITD